jgi:hypothetical protein
MPHKTSKRTTKDDTVSTSEIKARSAAPTSIVHGKYSTGTKTDKEQKRDRTGTKSQSLAEKKSGASPSGAKKIIKVVKVKNKVKGNKKAKEKK